VREQNNYVRKIVQLQTRSLLCREQHHVRFLEQMMTYLDSSRVTVVDVTSVVVWRSTQQNHRIGQNYHSKLLGCISTKQQGMQSNGECDWQDTTTDCCNGRRWVETIQIQTEIISQCIL